MPQSGFPIENLGIDKPEDQPYIETICKNAEHAMKNGLFIEWLECFVGAYNYQKEHTSKPNWEIANIASQAGLIEWDM